MYSLEKLCVLYLIKHETSNPVKHLLHILKLVNCVTLHMRRVIVRHLPYYYVDCVLLHVHKQSVCVNCFKHNTQIDSDRLPHLFCVGCCTPLINVAESILYVERVCAMYHYKKLRVIERSSCNVK